MRIKLTAIIILFAVSGIFSNEISYEDVDLKDLVGLSPVILVASKSEPFIEYKKVTVCGVNRQELFRPIPPYIETIHNFDLVEIVKNMDAVAIPGKIKVREAFHDSQLNIHTKYYKEKLSLSPLYKHYRAPGNNLEAFITRHKAIIIFLTYRQDANAFEYRAIDSWESVEKKDMIRNLLK